MVSMRANKIRLILTNKELKSVWWLPNVFWMTDPVAFCTIDLAFIWKCDVSWTNSEKRRSIGTPLNDLANSSSGYEH